MKKVLKKHIKQIIIVIVLINLCNVLAIIHPAIVRMIIDLDFSSENIYVNIIGLIIIYTCIHIILYFAKVVKNKVSNKFVMKILKEIREQLFNKVLNFKMKTFNKYNSSELYTRLTVDIKNLTNLFVDGLNTLVNNIIFLVFCMIMICITDINLAIISAVIMGLMGIVSYLFIKNLNILDDKILEKRDKQTKAYSELHNNNKVLYLFNTLDRNQNNIKKIYNKELDIVKKYIFIKNFSTWTLRLINTIGIFAILYYSLNINLTISIGSIYLVIYYLRDSQSYIKDIFNILETLQTSMNSYRRIKKLLEEKDDEILEENLEFRNIDGDIQFENVSMKYDKKIILNDISFTIKKGTKVTLAGRTGVGKTTITNVLMRLYDICEGKITIGGEDISEIPLSELRGNISYISQTPYILEASLRDNIILSKKEIKDEQILELVKEIGATNIIDRMDNGLDTVIKFNKLSYGELQIIAFLRAILHEANYYIFDEPTSNIDLKTERVIQNIIDKISRESTVIIIAHRKSTIESSDKIIYLKDGRVDKVVENVKID